jgi:iron(III) transport system permease protein
MSTAARLWLALGWVGFALLPWHLPEEASWFEWIIGYTAQGPRAALGLALVGGEWWLAPIGLPLLIVSWPLPRGHRREEASGLLVAAGLGGLALLAIQGFAIGIKGWTWSMLAELLGTEGPSQAGMGLGASLTVAAFLMLLCQGLAGRGWCRGDAFVTGALGTVVTLTTIFVFFPVAIILASAVGDEAGAFAPGQFADKFFDRSVWGLGCLASMLSCGVAWNTLILAILVGFGATALGLAFALVAVRAGWRFAGVLRILAVLPIITPPFVIGLALILLFGRAGSVTMLLADWLGIPPSRWIYGLPGVLIAQLLAFTPIAFLVLVGVVQGISPSLEEAAQTLRGRRWTVFATVSFPLMRPGLASAFLLGFVESMADFGNPLVLGGNFDVLSTKIFFAVVGAAHDQSRAAVLSIILLGFTLASFVLQNVWVGRRGYTTVTGKGDAGIPLALPRRVAWLCYAAVAPWIVFTGVIYSVILAGGFVRAIGRDYTLTFAHYVTGFRIETTPRGLFFSGSAWNSLFATIEIAAIAAPLTAAIGLLTAYLLTRQNFAGRRAFELATMLSFAIPGTVVGVSYILAFNVPPIEITGTALILVVCFVFRNMPVGVRSGIATLSQIDKSLDEASLTLGARATTTLRRVILPLLRPAIVASLIYSFVRAMTAVSAVIFLVSAQWNMATTYIVGRVEAGEFGLAIAYSSVLIVVMLIATSAIDLLIGERRLGRRMAGETAVRFAS